MLVRPAATEPYNLCYNHSSYVQAVVIESNVMGIHYLVPLFALHVPLLTSVMSDKY